LHAINRIKLRNIFAKVVKKDLRCKGAEVQRCGGEKGSKKKN
jgi:hypothetical protein